MVPAYIFSVIIKLLSEYKLVKMQYSVAVSLSQNSEKSIIGWIQVKLIWEFRIFTENSALTYL